MIHNTLVENWREISGQTLYGTNCEHCSCGRDRAIKTLLGFEIVYGCVTTAKAMDYSTTTPHFECHSFNIHHFIPFRGLEVDSVHLELELALLSGFPLYPFLHVFYVFLLIYETQNHYKLHYTGEFCPCEPKPAGCDFPLQGPLTVVEHQQTSLHH